MIYGVEDRFTDRMAMIERPPPNHWIEFCNEFTCGQIATFPDLFSDLGMNALMFFFDGVMKNFNVFLSGIFVSFVPESRSLARYA